MEPQDLQSDSTSVLTQPDVLEPAKTDFSSDKWARLLGVTSIVIALILGFKSEISNFFSTPRIQVDLQDSPMIYTRLGFLRANIFVVIKTGAIGNTAIEGAELELKHSDGTTILMPARARAIVYANNTLLFPFAGLTAKANQPVAEYVTFEEPIPEQALNSILSIEYRLNLSLHAKIVPESVEGYVDPAAVAARERAELATIRESAKVKKTRSGVKYIASYSYTPAYSYISSSSNPTGYYWSADEQLRKEARQVFDANYRFRPGSYVATIKVFGQNKALLVTRRYQLTILESQSSAVREAWESFNGRRYAKEQPPVRDASFTLRPAD